MSDAPSWSSRPCPNDFRLGTFARWTFGKHWRALAVILVAMAGYSAFLALRLFTVGLIVDVAVYQMKTHAVEKQVQPGAATTPPSPIVVDKGRVLQGFEKGWNLVFDSEPPTAQLNEPGRFYRFLIGFTVAAMVFSLLMAFVHFVREYKASELVVDIIADVRQWIVDHLVTLPLGYFHRQKAGDLLSRVTNDVSAMSQCLRIIFESLVQEPIAIVAACGAMVAISWKLAFAIMPFYVLLFLPIFRSGRKVKRYGRSSLEKLSEVTEDLQQLFTGMRTVKAFVMEEHEKVDFAGKNRQHVRKQLRTARARTTARTMQEAGYNIGSALLLLVMGWLLYSGISTLDEGSLTVFMAALLQVYSPIKQLSRAWTQLQESKGGYDRIAELLREPPMVPDDSKAPEFTGITSEIRFEAVTFSYPTVVQEGRPPVLNAVSFSANAGEVVALVGPSGAGKSTLVDLIARFYDPLEGRILVDGVDIATFRRGSYLRSVAIVSQDPFLFNTSIEDNILYGRSGASRAEVEEAAKQAYAHDFILEQPEGYATRIGERGVMLSGGQRQRITIARAILKNASILILDEATSALDTASEKEVQRALENLMRDRTTFVIAHRLSTITNANRILVLAEGKLVEEGTHEELLAQKGHYFALRRLQEHGVA